MNHKTVSAQNNAYNFVTEVANSLSNKLAHPTGASSSCIPADIISALKAFMESAFYLQAHYSFNIHLTYPGLQVGRPSGCDRCPAIAGRGAVSGNDTECPQNSTTTSSAPTPLPSPTPSPPPTNPCPNPPPAFAFQNPGFESGNLSPWLSILSYGATAVVDTTNPHSGSYSL